MAEAGYCQNEEKKDLVPSLQRGIANRQFGKHYSKHASGRGKVVPHARHLGALYCWNDSVERELRQRMRAIRRGWAER
eukprot:7991-Amphidinium_carterae.1